MTKEFGNSNILDTWAANGSKVEPEIDKKNSGWLSGERPAFQYMNYLQNILFKQINYLMRSGVPEWNAETSYLQNDFTTYNGILYRALSANLNSTPPSANWIAIGGGSTTITDISALKEVIAIDGTFTLPVSGKVGGKGSWLKYNAADDLNFGFYNGTLNIGSLTAGFSDDEDNPNTVNIYESAGDIVVQNKTGVEITLFYWIEAGV